jgi:hypothetical protein
MALPPIRRIGGDIAQPPRRSIVVASNEHHAQHSLGELDGARLTEALRQLLDIQRGRGVNVDAVTRLGATCFAERAHRTRRLTRSERCLRR